MDDSRLFERTVSSAIQYSGPVFDVYSDTVELCNKKTARRDYLKPGRGGRGAAHG